MLPLHYVQPTNTLLLGFVYGVEYAVLYAIEQMIGCRTRACLITPSDFDLHMQHRAHWPPPDDLTFDAIQNPAKMALTLSSYGALLDANEVAIGRCREYLWARMETPSGTSNILFKSSANSSGSHRCDKVPQNAAAAPVAVHLHRTSPRPA